MKCLRHAYETAYYFQLTLVARLFDESFACLLPSFEYHFNSVLLTFITGVCSEIPCFICLAFCRNQLFKFYRNSMDWLPHYAGSGCGDSRIRLLTVLYLFFFCLHVLYFYIAPSRVFCEYMSCKLFR